MGRNGQARFWCGFCIKLIDLKEKGVDAWKERFDHIDEHFMGHRDLPEQSIEDWVPVDNDKPKRDITSSHAFIQGNEDHSDSDSNGNSSDSTMQGDGDGGAKRKRCKNDSGGDRPAKLAREATSA